MTDSNEVTRLGNLGLQARAMLPLRTFRPRTFTVSSEADQRRAAFAVEGGGLALIADLEGFDAVCAVLATTGTTGEANMVSAASTAATIPG